MVKRGITITTILLILTMAVGLIVMLNKSSLAADDDIASGTSGTCSWVIDKDGVLTISPLDGESGVLDSYISSSGYNSNTPWKNFRTSITKVVIESGVKPGESCSYLFYEFEKCSEIVGLNNFDTSNVTNMTGMFCDCSKLTSIDLSNFDTSKVTSTAYMFYDCKKLTTLDVSGFDTGSLIDAESMFHYCEKLTTLDVSGFDTSKAKYLNSMFDLCSNLTYLDVSRWDTSNVTDMSWMFGRCYKLESLDVSGFNTSNVTNMNSMFYQNRNLTSLDVSNFDTRKVTKTYQMFTNCSKLTSLDVSGFDTSKVTEMSTMFAECSGLTSLDVSNFDTSNVTDMTQMFHGCSGITSLDVSHFNTSKVTRIGGLFYNCSKLTTLNVSNFDVSRVNEFLDMFGKCSSLTHLDCSSFDTKNGTNHCYRMFKGCTNLETLDIRNFDTNKMTYLVDFFSDCPNLSKVIIGKNFNFCGNNITGDEGKPLLPTPPSNKTTGKWIREDNAYGPFTPEELRDNYTSDMAGTWIWEPAENPYAVLDENDTLNFMRVKAIIENNTLGEVKSISGGEFTGTIFTVNEGGSNNGDRTWNNIATRVKKVIFIDEIKPKNTSYWFDSFHKCTEMNLAKLNTSNVVNMNFMFNDCGKLDSLDVSSFNTSNVTSMDHTFNGCASLTSIDVSNFDVSKVTTMSCMFNNSYKLKSVNVNGWNVSNVIDFNHMFNNSSIETLDLSSFDTSKATFMKKMLDGAKSLKSIVLGSDFVFKGNNISSITNQAILPIPEGLGYSGKWIREDKEFGPYTADELRNNYNGSTMAGKWVWDKFKYKVEYKFDGTIPNGVSALPEEAEYEFDSQVTVAQNATAPGYTFSGWSRTGTFEMPAENVEITGSFTANTDTPYKVEHYLEDLNEGEYTLTKTDNLTGTTDTEATATAKDYEGFTFDSSITGTNLSGNIAGDGSLVLKVYYKRNSYNVTFAYTGDVPNEASSLPQGEIYKYGAEINVPENATAEGYTFSGWIKDYITMPAQDIEITGYFIENPKSYNYKVEYYFDGELDSSLEEILNAEKDEEISITPQTPLKHGEKNYTLISNNHNITISINEEENVINVYYETDVLDFEIDNPEDTVEGDGIPDKYQIKITYKVENGSWDDGTKGTKTNVITLKDKDGNYAEDGTGELNVPQVGNKPSEGYEMGSWNSTIPKNVSSKDNGKEFVYSYKTISKVDIARAKGNLSNPKTDDIMHNYLLVGIAGVLVLIVVRKIRRKYSRKAKKIQF